MIKKILYILILFILIFMILDKKNFTSFNDLDRDESRFIAHAGGGFKDIIYSNSKESVLKSIENGFKLIELDLLETSDGFIVAAHDWKSFKKNCIGYDKKIDDSPITYQEFNECNYQINSINFTKLNEETINGIFVKNPDIFLLTDKIKNYELLSKRLDFKDRIIPETFNVYDYILTKFHGFNNSIFPFKKYNLIIEIFLNIRIINISYEDFIMNKERVTDLFNKGLDIYVYSSNDKIFIEKYIKENITGVYTDFWNFNIKKCESLTKCRSY